MKKILIIALAFSFTMLAACKKQQIATVSANPDAPQITSPSSGTSVAVTVGDSSQVMNITWKKATYGVSAVVTYFVQADSASDGFKKPLNLGTVIAKDTLAITNGVLNSELLAAGFAPNAASNVEIRVGSAIYGTDTVYSTPVTMSFTTLKLANKLWLPGSYEGYSPSTAPTIPALTPTTFQGYAYFGQAGSFKFTSAPDYVHVNYGYEGPGTLTTNGSAGDITYGPAGVYYLNADITNLTYSATLISTFGIIGPATPQGWNASTDMAYNTSTGLWTITLDLVGNSPLKFRANDAWDINYGPSDSNALSGSLIFNDPGAITIVDSGNYTITLDMTQTTHKTYWYTIVKN